MYSSYLVFPLMIFFLWKTFTNALEHDGMKKLTTFAMVLCIIASSLFVYARYIERYIVIIQERFVEVGFKGKIIVFADPHLGVYKSNSILKDTVNKINQQGDIDAVLIPGDFTFYPKDSQNLEDLFSPLNDINYPVYAVLGNHDSEQPGPPLQKELEIALEKNGVIFLHNEFEKIPNTQITILGLGDHWAQEDDISKINQFTQDDNVIVLTHNPDTTSQYKNAIADLTVCGHTHGGQIRIPFLYKKVIPTKGDFDRGIYNLEDNKKLFITSGIGETGLPLRFLNPPVLDVLNLK